MKEQSTETGGESRPTWESLEAFARQGVQRLLQQVLEEEVEEVLGRLATSGGRPWTRPPATATGTASRAG